MDLYFGQKFISKRQGSDHYILYAINDVYKDQVELIVLNTFPPTLIPIGQTITVGVDTVQLMVQRERFQLVNDNFEIET